MTHIKGTTVILIQHIEKETDPFGAPVYETVEKEVNNVLIAPVSSDDIINSLNLYGKRAVYQLGIPKGDTNTWEDQTVRFFDKEFRVFGEVTEGIEALVPLDWNRKVMVEQISGGGFSS